MTALTALIARSGAQAVDWIGTSMGGLLGMVAAAQPKSPVARLVVNDVGPSIEPVALERIGAYVGQAPAFDSFEGIERYLRQISAPFGDLTDAQWRFLTETNVRRGADGRWRMAYDPGIAVPFKATPAPADLWSVWDAIRCPTLVLHGERSDLLSADTAAQMAARGPRPMVVDVRGVGHAPMLLDAAQIAPVLAFLRAG
jgi:pimeloyl-ACP methyl ester carboxylesterase